MTTPSPASRAERRMGLPGGGVGLAMSALAGIGLLFLALPVVALLARAVASEALGLAFSDPAVVDALLLSLATTAASLVIVVLLGVPLGYALARARWRGRWLAEAVVDLPIVLPPSVAGLALLFAFGRRSPLGQGLEMAGVVIPFTTLAVVVAQVFVSMPFLVRAARSGFRAVDPGIEEAARVDGATEVSVLRRVTLPLSASAVGAGIVLAWARAMGEFGATIMFAGNLEGRTQTLPLLVYSEFQGSLDAAVAAAAILVVAALGVLIAVRLLRWPSGISWFD